jgi:DNA polymerase III epsilon subunit-like protein
MKEKTFCAVDTETTNINCAIADAVEVTFLPLTTSFDIDTTKKHFTTLINPGIKSLEAGVESLAFNKIPIDEIYEKGVPKKKYPKLLQEWMKENSIIQIEPVAQNWGFDRVVLCNLLGFDLCEELIYHRGHDSLSLAIVVRDLYRLNGLKDPFRSTRLVDLAREFGMSNSGAHRTLKDCQMCAYVYKELLKMLEIAHRG